MVPVKLNKHPPSYSKVQQTQTYKDMRRYNIAYSYYSKNKNYYIVTIY